MPSGEQSILRMSPAPGMMYALSRVIYPGLSDETYNKWYDEVHLGDVINTGLVDLALRYKNVNADSKYPYLAIYRVPDFEALQSSEGMAKLMAIPRTHESLPDGKDLDELLETERGSAERIEVYDKSQSAGQG
jgi:hypothetical protein